MYPHFTVILLILYDPHGNCIHRFQTLKVGYVNQPGTEIRAPLYTGHLLWSQNIVYVQAMHSFPQQKSYKILQDLIRFLLGASAVKRTCSSLC